ncbi:MAG: SRPBCC family protein [Ilumatobacteraceae bacterium]
MTRASERLRGTGDAQERVMASAAYLAEHLAEVPAIVIPTIIGRHDGSGRPGLFDSVIQAAWSFCLALRARGLGTTWVTAALQDEARVKEILGIPPDLTEIVLLPVAWTKGTDFRRAPRHPARSITSFDRFGTTFASGPGEVLRFEDGPGLFVEVDIAAPPAVLWPLVTDLDVPAAFSDEFLGAEWQDEARGVGAVFVGRNRHPAVGEWTIRCFVDAWDEPRSFGWSTSDPDDPGARWRFDLAPLGGHTRLRFTYGLGPGPSGTTAALAANPDKEARVLRRRLGEVRSNMERTVAGIKQLAEDAG